MPERRLAVAFGSSFLGFPTHFGFLRGLIEAGWAPAAVAGCSTGAVVAGLYAAGAGLEAMEQLFTLPRLSRCFYQWQAPWRALATFLGVPGYAGIFLGDRLGDLLRERVGDLRIEDCPAASLHIAVANLGRHRVEMRSRGPLVETILASCAMPGVMAPRRIGGELLWDGALGSSVPVEPYLDDTAVTHLATHSILFENQLRARRQGPHNFAGALFAASQLKADELLRWQLELARRCGKTVQAAETVTPCPRVGLPLTLPPPKPWPQHARDLMEAGAASARTVIAGFTGGGETPAASC